MLTPEDRQRIEEEERRRQGEEQYREEVRARMLLESREPKKQPIPWKSYAIVLVAGAGVTLIATSVTPSPKPAGPVESPAPVAARVPDPKPSPVVPSANEVQRREPSPLPVQRQQVPAVSPQQLSKTLRLLSRSS
jgi:hypothetical protein